jgi:hypothetical protein
MDHPCYKCGQIVEDGKPFCLQCGAPQIRVAVPEPAMPSVAGVISSDEPAIYALEQSKVPEPLRPAGFFPGIEWPRGLRVCALAALISVVVMSFRLVVPLLAVLGAGVLAVIFYRHRSPDWKANGRSGAQLGAVTGLLCSSVIALACGIVFAVLQAGGQVREQALEALKQAASRSNDPQMQATLDLLMKPEGLAAKLILAVIGFFLISVVVGSVAGALTGAFLGRRKRP